MDKMYSCQVYFQKKKKTTTARRTGEEPVDAVPDRKSSTSDRYRLVVNNDKSAVMAFSDGEPWICREEKNN